MPVSINLHFFPPSLSPPSVTVPRSFSLWRVSAHACDTVSCVVQELCSDKRDKEKEELTDSESVLGENIECSLLPLRAGHMDRPTQQDVSFPLLQQLSQLNC